MEEEAAVELRVFTAWSEEPLSKVEMWLWLFIRKLENAEQMRLWVVTASCATNVEVFHKIPDMRFPLRKQLLFLLPA